MPRPKLWSFVVEGDFLLLKNGTEIHHTYGPVLDARAVTDKLTHIKVTKITFRLS